MTVTVVGLGVVGGAFAEGLKKMGFNKVYGIDNNEETLRKAENLGIIDNGFITGKKALTKSDIVVISLYPDLLKEFILENNKYFKKGCFITDVTGIKKKILTEVCPLLDERVDFILGHPMAGREKRGIDYADISVFKNANYIIIKQEKNKKENLKLLEKVIKNLGFKNINYLSADEHDEIIAFTSQLTHAIAVALVNSDDEKFNTNEFIGDSYRDLTRIAKINEDLWSELFLGNKEYLLRRIKDFEEKMQIIKDALITDNSEVLRNEFRKSTSRRERIT